MTQPEEWQSEIAKRDWSSLWCACDRYCSANAASRSHVNKPITLDQLRQATKALEKKGTAKVYLPPEGSHCVFIAVGHVNLEHDIERLSGYKSFSQMVQPLNPVGYPWIVHQLPGEVGGWENGFTLIRFILTTSFRPYPNAGGPKGTMLSFNHEKADVYPLFIFGKEVWERACPFKGESAINVVPFEITDDNWGVQLEVAATQL